MDAHAEGDEGRWRDEISPVAMNIMSSFMASLAFLTGSMVRANTEGPLMSDRGVASGVTSERMPKSQAPLPSGDAVRSQRVVPRDPRGKDSTLGLVELTVMVVVGSMSVSTMIALGPMGMLVTPLPPSPRAFNLHFLFRPIDLAGSAESCVLGAACRLLEPLEDANPNPLEAERTMLLTRTGTCRGEATRPGCTSPTLAQAAVWIAWRLRSAPSGAVGIAIHCLLTAQDWELMARGAALPHLTSPTRDQWQRIQGAAQFEGGLVLTCSRLGRTAGADLVSELARNQVEGNTRCLGPTLALPTPPGPVWRPDLRLAIRTFSGRWKTMQSESPRGSGPRVPSRAATLPIGWPLSARAWPRGPLRRDPSPPPRATTSRALTTTSPTRPPGSRSTRSPRRSLATIVS